MQLLGITLSSLTPSEILGEIEKYLDSSSLHHIVTVNPEYIVEAQNNEEFKEVVNNADIQTIDGIGILVALEYLKSRSVGQSSGLGEYIRFLSAYIRTVTSKNKKNLQRVSGVDLIWLLVQQSFMKGRKMYLLGGREHVSAQAVKRLSQFNEHIQFRSSNGVDDIKNPDSVQAKKIIDDINAFAPDVLLVAYGHPWQDVWIYQHKDQLKARVAIGVGGSFDYIAQRIPRAPGWLRSVGLEWLYRLIRQPQRFARIMRATVSFSRLVIGKET